MNNIWKTCELSVYLQYKTNTVMKKLTLDKGPDRNWQLLENGYMHTDGLTKEEADEMLERHSRIFPNIEWCLFYKP